MQYRLLSEPFVWPFSVPQATPLVRFAFRHQLSHLKTQTRYHRALSWPTRTESHFRGLAVTQTQLRLAAFFDALTILQVFPKHHLVTSIVQELQHTETRSNYAKLRETSSSSRRKTFTIRTGTIQTIDGCNLIALHTYVQVHRTR